MTLPGWGRKVLLLAIIPVPLSTSNPFGARSTRFYYISTTSTHLQSDQQRFRYKYIVHINDALFIWQSNFWLINMVDFSMEQVQVLSTLVNIRFF